MKNHHPYRLTDTGVRIPKRTIKWMTPLKKDASQGLGFLQPTGKTFTNPFVSNFIIPSKSKDAPGTNEVIDATDRKECVSDEV